MSIILNNDLLEECKRTMAENGVLHHPFLQRMESETLSSKALKDFIVHWYKTAEAHRLAYPCLIGNIQNDEVRFDLITILNDEYGNGDRARIHEKLLGRVLDALGVTKEDVLKAAPLPSITKFNDFVKRIWKDGDQAFAYGFHFGLEFLATEQQGYFARGMQKYESLSKYNREYFDLHAVAEPLHVARSEAGFRFFAERPKDRKNLLRGVEMAENMLRDIWNDFGDKLFPAAYPEQGINLQTGRFRNLDYSCT